MLLIILLMISHLGSFTEFTMRAEVYLEMIHIFKNHISF